MLFRGEGTKEEVELGVGVGHSCNPLSTAVGGTFSTTKGTVSEHVPHYWEILHKRELLSNTLCRLFS